MTVRDVVFIGFVDFRNSGSISAINAAELQVKFSQPVTKADVVDSNGDLVANVFFKNAVGVTGDASLSEDGKTLTISGSWEGTYLFELAKDKVKSTEGKYVPTFAEKVVFEDKEAPTFVKTTQVSASEVAATFSEPIKSKGTVTAKLEDGTDVSSDISVNINGSDLEFDLTDSAIGAGKKVNITIAGLTDYADNLVNPNPVTFTVQKGDKDGVAPEVTEITPVNAKKFEIKFSEEVLGLTIGDIKIGNVALVSPGATLTQDKTDKTKYTVTLDTAKTGLQTISIAAAAYTDLSGEDGKAASKIVNFGTDTVAPTLASTSVAKNKDGKEVLTLEFSEDVELKATGIVTFSSTQVKDYVTTTSHNLTVDASKITAVQGDATKLEILLTDISGVVSGAEYTVSLPASLVNDTADNANAAKANAFKFNRGTDTATAKPEVDKTLDSTDNFTGNQVADNGIKVISNNSFKVKFVGDVDNATVVNKDNYKVSGATVSNVSLASNGEVTVTLELDSNTYTGLRDVTISGVKTKAGVAMDSYTTKEYFQENVRPTVTKAEVSTIVDATEAVDGAEGSASVDVTPANGSVTPGVATGATATKTVEYTVGAAGAVTDADANAVVTLTEDLNIDGETGLGTYSGTITLGGVDFTVTNVKVNDTFTLSTVAAVAAVPASAGTTTVTLTFSEAIQHGVQDDFELFIKGEKVPTAVGTGVVSSATPNVVTLTIGKGLTVTDFTNGVQLKAANTIDITDKVGNALNLPADIDLKLE